jgi:hypothetical protein
MRLLVSILTALVYLAGFVTPIAAQDEPTQAPIIIDVQGQDAPSAPLVTVPEPASPPVTSTGLSNNNTYTNVDGNTVHSPAYSTTGAVPPGVTAQCGDGAYSFSQHAQGACSGHGGVAQWQPGATSSTAPTAPAPAAPATGCGSRGGPGGPRTASGRCPSR